MHQAKTKLSKLVEMVEAGQEVQLAGNGAPEMNLVLAKKSFRPLFGQFEPIHAEIPDGFDIDAPMPEWEECLFIKDKLLKPAQSGERG